MLSLYIYPIIIIFHDYFVSLFLFSVPESHFKLNYRTDTEGIVHIKCSAFNVYPEPKLSLKYELYE